MINGQIVEEIGATKETYSREYTFGVIGNHIIKRMGRIMSMKNSSDTIWNRTSALPICSTPP